MSSEREALHEIAQWCEAYPASVFPEPTEDDWQLVYRALKDAGVSSDALHASWARHLLAGIGKIARDALNEEAA